MRPLLKISDEPIVKSWDSLTGESQKHLERCIRLMQYIRLEHRLLGGCGVLL